MQKFIPALKVVLLGSIGIILVAIVMNLFFGNLTSMVQMMFPLIGGLFAYGVLTNFNLAAPKCPKCSAQQPVWRKPTSLRQRFLGGWTCNSCGTEIDRHGRAIAQETERA